ncbi:hypothetical protein HZB58_01000 [Candidatus Gottesmanbacteria bacterium]|nr:hypothetical protein [Candidatus Gottesmanbacteria bacterium]
MALEKEIERLADQYGGIGAANGHDAEKTNAILEPVLRGKTKTALRSLSEGLWARSRGEDDRYADLAQVVDGVRRRR